MSEEIDVETIRGLADSMREMLRSYTSESKRDGFANVEDLISATRCRTESIESSRAEYFTFALCKLREQDTRVGDALALHFMSTFNKNCSVVDIGKGPVILIDLHQSQILEDMGRLFLLGGKSKLCEAMVLRFFAEHFVASGKEELGTYFAVRRSILMEDEQVPELSEDQQTEIERSTAIQDAYILTHEVGHILWARDQLPKDRFVSWATRWIAADASVMAQRYTVIKAEHADLQANLSERFKTQKESEAAAHILSQASPWIENSAHSSDQIRATIEYRCDPASGFIEELWSDTYAWISCMQLFSGNWPAEQVYCNLTLALRNLATIDAMRRIAEGDMNPRTIDEVSTRRSILRLALRSLIGDLRDNDDLRNVIQLRDESEWEVDMMKISIETEERYREVLWNPMSLRGFAELCSIPSKQEVASQYTRCQQEFGDCPALKILREHPVNSSNVGQLFHNQ